MYSVVHYIYTDKKIHALQISQSFLVNKTLMVNQALCSAFRESILVLNHSVCKHTTRPPQLVATTGEKTNTS